MEAHRATSPGLSVAFLEGPASTVSARVEIAARWLGGDPVEEIFTPVATTAGPHGLRLFRSGDLLLGHAQARFVASEIAQTTEALYRRVIDAANGRHLLRIWNYVPQINALTDRLENYRAFCLGRSVAFEHALGTGYTARLPAASAVGTIGNRIEVIFVAGNHPPVHCENPAQVPAYQYPVEHGPRSPSFARATVGRENGRTWTFISGTAAIRGHETVAPDTLDAQLDCTLENLRLVGQASGLGADVRKWPAATRHFKVYLRHASDLAATRAWLDRGLFRAADKVIYLESDICRAALKVEIEATLVS